MHLTHKWCRCIVAIALTGFLLFVYGWLPIITKIRESSGSVDFLNISSVPLRSNAIIEATTRSLWRADSKVQPALLLRSGGSVIINIPEETGNPLKPGEAGENLVTHPADFTAPSIWLANLAASKLSLYHTIVACCPSNEAAFRSDAICDCWSGVRTLSAIFASSWIRASRSC